MRMQKNLNLEKIIFKVVQMKSLQCILLIKKSLSFDIFMGGNLQNLFMEHPIDFWHKIKINHFVLLAIAASIPQRLKTAFVIQGNKYGYQYVI